MIEITLTGGAGAEELPGLATMWITDWDRAHNNSRGLARIYRVKYRIQLFTQSGVKGWLCTPYGGPGGQSRLNPQTRSGTAGAGGLRG